MLRNWTCAQCIVGKEVWGWMKDVCGIGECLYICGSIFCWLICRWVRVILENLTFYIYHIMVLKFSKKNFKMPLITHMRCT